MAGFLYRLGRWIAAHRWLGAAGVGGHPRRGFVVAISRVGAETSNNVDLPGTGSQKATDLLADRFPPQQNGQNPIVFHVDSGKLTDSDNEKAINQAAKAIQGLPDVVSAPSPFSDDTSGAYVSDDEKTAFIPVLLDISSADLDEEEAQAVLDAAEKPAEPLGMEVAAGGSIGSELSTPATESSELVGIIVAMIILTLAFGSIVAMGMPIISAVVGLAVGLTGIGLVGHLFAVPDVGTTLAIMIGLGVGIDYALFLVSRHRAQLAEGEEMRESIALALATSGSAIVFAGGTVVIALVSLAVAGIPLVSSLGYSSAIAVLTAVLAATTLLPAVMSLVGRHIHSLSLPAFLRPRPKEPGTGHWARWGQIITRHPLIAIACFIALLAVLIVPLFALELGQEDVGATPKDTQERQSYDLISAGFGPGYNGPLLIAVDIGTPATADPKVEQQENQANALQAQLEQSRRRASSSRRRSRPRAPAAGPAGGARVRAGEPGGPGRRPGPPGRRPAGRSSARSRPSAAPARGRDRRHPRAGVTASCGAPRAACSSSASAQSQRQAREASSRACSRPFRPPRRGSRRRRPRPPTPSGPRSRPRRTRRSACGGRSRRPGPRSSSC